MSGQIQQSPSPLTKLPDDMMFLVFGVSGMVQTAKAARVCKHWAKLASNPLSPAALKVNESLRWIENIFSRIPVLIPLPLNRSHHAHDCRIIAHTEQSMSVYARVDLRNGGDQNHVYFLGYDPKQQVDRVSFAQKEDLEPLGVVENIALFHKRHTFFEESPISRVDLSTKRLLEPLDYHGTVQKLATDAGKKPPKTTAIVTCFPVEPAAGTAATDAILVSRSGRVVQLNVLTGEVVRHANFSDDTSKLRIWNAAKINDTLCFLMHGVDNSCLLKWISLTDFRVLNQKRFTLPEGKSNFDTHLKANDKHWFLLTDHSITAYALGKPTDDYRVRQIWSFKPEQLPVTEGSIHRFPSLAQLNDNWVLVPIAKKTAEETHFNPSSVSKFFGFEILNLRNGEIILTHNFDPKKLPSRHQVQLHKHAVVYSDFCSSPQWMHLPTKQVMPRNDVPINFMANSNKSGRELENGYIYPCNRQILADDETVPQFSILLRSSNNPLAPPPSSGLFDLLARIAACFKNFLLELLCCGERS